MSDIQIIQGDCLEVMKTFADNQFDLVLTDPPYPDQHAVLYKYSEKPILYLDHFLCRQLVFWSARASFSLSYTAVHIWDKMIGIKRIGSQYERIFERNGDNKYRVYSRYLINSTVAAKYGGDTFTGHPSQKPIKLICELIEECSEKGDTVLDPFLGSGTTAVACERMGRNCVGIEISEEYCEIARKRVQEEKDKMGLFNGD